MAPVKTVCRECKQNVTKRHHSLLCNGKCGQWYHKICTGLTENDYKFYAEGKGRGKWACKICRVADNDSSDSGSEDESTDEKNVTKEKKNSRSNRLSCNNVRSILAKDNPSNKELLILITKKFEEMEEALNFSGSIIEKMQETLKEIKIENRKLRKENEEIKKQVKELQFDINQVKLKQASENVQERSKNIIILGTNAAANVTEEVENIFNKIDVKLTSEEFFVKVLPSKSPTKPVLVTMKSADVRDLVLEKRRKAGKIDTIGCNITGPKRQIYINEDTPREIRMLLGKAKSLKENGFKYVWLKYGKVFCRKTDDSEIMKITSEKIIEELLQQ